MDTLKKEFSKYLKYLEEIIETLNIELPFPTRAEFNKDGNNCGIIVQYDYIRSYKIFDENIQSYIETIKEEDKVKILNIQTIQVNKNFREQGHFKYMINSIEEICKKKGLILKVSEINNENLIKMLVKNGYYIVGNGTQIFTRENFPENFIKREYYDIKAFKFFLESQSEDNKTSTFSMKNKRRSKRRSSLKKSRRSSLKKKRQSSLKKKRQSSVKKRRLSRKL
jgi:hypothetical protein